MDAVVLGEGKAMNPWEIVSWICAACVAALIIVVTAVTIRSLVKSKPADQKPKRIV